jgi:peptide/nickel transport system substrate-binding protein
MALTAAIAVSLLAVSGAGGVGTQTPKRGGTVVVALPPFAEPACLRTWAPVCGSGSGWPTKVLAGAFTSGPDGLRPELVSHYTLTKDPFTVTYYIRPEARWSDGVPVSAQDFVFARKTYLKYGEFSKDDDFRTAIRRVYAVGAKTVTFAFRSRYGNWRSLLDFPPLPHHALAGEDLANVWKDRIDNPKTGRPIGSGPFLVGPWERGRQVTLIRNPNYWGSHPAYLDGIVVRFVRIGGGEALRSGEADLTILRLGSEELRGDARFKLLSTLNSGWEHFEIRSRAPGGHPALKSKLVRRALAYGIDRVALVRTLFPDVKPPPPPLDSTLYLRNERSYRPNWNIYRHRPAEARRLLAQAGCRQGPDGIYACAGERLSLRFVTTAGAPHRARTLELVQAQLRQVGVEVVPSYVLSDPLFEQLLPSGNFDVALFLWQNKSAPEEVNSLYRCGAESNFSGYCSRLYTSDINQLDRIVDPVRRAAVANRADRRMAGDVPILPLYQRPFTFGVRKPIQGFVPNGFGSILWNAENWWLER